MKRAWESIVERRDRAYAALLDALYEHDRYPSDITRQAVRAARARYQQLRREAKRVHAEEASS